RRIEEGPHPEIEIGRLLTEVHRVECAAPLAGAIEYRRRGREPMAMAVLHGYINNEGDAWQHTLDQLSGFFEHVATLPELQMHWPPPLRRRLGEDVPAPPVLAADLLRNPLAPPRLLGQRLGELHLALAGPGEQSEFAAEPISLQYQRSVYQSLRNILIDML